MEVFILQWLKNSGLEQIIIDSIKSVLPVYIIITLLSIAFIPLSSHVYFTLHIGTLFVVAGLVFFSLGTDSAMTPIGEGIGSLIAHSDKKWFIVLVSLIIGFSCALAEPNIILLTKQFPSLDSKMLVFLISSAVGIFVMIAVVRIYLKIKLRTIFLVCYTMIMVLALLVEPHFLSAALDSGGVITGPVVVPFLMAIGVGLSKNRSDDDAEDDVFGFVGLSALGPMLSVLIVGVIAKPKQAPIDMFTLQHGDNTKQLFSFFYQAIPQYGKEIASALLPLCIFFALFQCSKQRFDKERMMQVWVGLLYTWIGLVLFLCGVYVGYMPVGHQVGMQIGLSNHAWLMIPIGMLLAYFIVLAEPGVYVLNKQVSTVTADAIPKSVLSLCLSLGISISIGLALLRIMFDIPLLVIILPILIVSLILSFFVPPLFTAIAFDSGGVASGPMSAAFLMPLAMGFCSSFNKDIATFAFGLVALVAIAPLATIQVVGFIVSMKQKKIHESKKVEEEIIYCGHSE